MKKIISLLSALIFAAIFISGCGPSAVVVRERPAPPRYSQPLAPGPNYIWVSGEWIIRHGRYQYRNGYWVASRRSRVHYVEGHWESRRNGWVWVHGYWR